MKRTGWAQGIYQQSATQKEMLGAERITADGRKFRYCRNGATALAAGIPTVAAAAVANNINCAPAVAAAVGDTVIQITIGNTAVTADQYKDGYIQGNSAGGIGMQYRIVSHNAAAGNGIVTVQLADPILVALVVATSKVSFIGNPFAAVVVGAAAGLFVGVPPIAVTAYYYFWNQVGGVCTALVDNAVAVGSELAVGTATFGIATAYTTQVCGTLFGTAGVTAHHKPVFLKNSG